MRVRRVEVIVVSSDDGFLIELGPLIGERYRTRTVDSPDALAFTAETGRWIAIIDAVSLTDARAAVARMEQQHRGGHIIVIAADVEEWGAALKRGSIHAVLPREQLAGERLTSLLNDAEARLLNVEVPAQASDSAAAPAAKAFASLPRQRAIIGVATGVLLLGAIALGTWWWQHPSKHASAPASAQSNSAASAAAAKPQTVLELLSAARVAFRDQKLLLPRADGEPHGDSALELYTQVLSQEPDNDEALDGVRRLFSVGKARIQTDLAGGKLDDAVRLLASFKTAGVDPDALRDIEASISAARPKWLAAKAQESISAGDFASAEQLLAQLSAAGADRNTIAELRRAIDGKKADLQLTAMANDVKAAIDSGALIDPVNDNAHTRVQAMRAVSRNSPVTLAAQRDLQAALLARAQEAIKKDQFDVAQRYIAAADNSSGADVAEIKRALQSETDALAQRSAAAAAAELRAKAASVAASAPNPATLTAPPANTPHFIAARATTALNVTYPAAAANSNIQGYAVVEFTLHPDGSASDAAIVEANPVRVFDHAAITAVVRAHYDASALANQQPQRARIRLTFKPN